MKLIVNDQIHVSDIRISDKSAYLEHLKAKEIYDNTLRIPFPYTEADADAWLALMETGNQEQPQPFQWAIRNTNDYLIGGIGFEDFIIGKDHRTEIGYWLAKPLWGQGIMTAVVPVACQFAFSNWGLVKITAHVFSFNPASARVLEKCGFGQEGYLKKHFVKDERYVDVKVYALVR
jgi:RimJ/RimL family protein N-acetyltransferase